jgi:DNA-binding NarL/FixJ family response regulator
MLKHIMLNPEQADSMSGLSGREKEILQLIAESNSNKEIADKLHISVKTAETHRNNIMRKLDIHDAVGLTRYAIENGLISGTLYE